MVKENWAGAVQQPKDNILSHLYLENCFYSKKKNYKEIIITHHCHSEQELFEGVCCCDTCRAMTVFTSVVTHDPAGEGVCAGCPSVLHCVL